MNFNWIDFIVGFLLIGSMLHLSFGHSGKRFPSLFGKSPKANIFYSEAITLLAIEIYVFTYDVTTLLSNGVLLGIIAMYLCYLFFGSLLHKRLQEDNASKINNSALEQR